MLCWFELVCKHCELVASVDFAADQAWPLCPNELYSLAGMIGQLGQVWRVQLRSLSAHQAVSIQHFRPPLMQSACCQRNSTVKAVTMTVLMQTMRLHLQLLRLLIVSHRQVSS